MENTKTSNQNELNDSSISNNEAAVKTAPERIFKVGIIGLGCRGESMTGLVAERDDVCITAVCDVYDDRVSMMQERLAAQGLPRPVGYTDYHRVIDSPDTEVIFVFAAWEAHVDIAVAAMEAGKPVAFEVGGAYTIDDCRRLVETYERTRTPAMMLENCMYGIREMTVTEMARDGVFGEIMHVDGGYMHDLRSEISFGERNRHYRLRNYLARNCENYPTHELGPICRLLEINEGNSFVSLASFASASRGINDYAARTPGVPAELRDAHFAQGDVVTTILTTARGQTVKLTLDTTLARPYSRGLTVHGTRGYFSEDTLSVYSDSENTEADHFKWREFWGNFDSWRERYQPELWREYTESGTKRGHGGMDFLVIDAFMTSLHEGEPMPIDIYDAAVMMAVTPLSELSISRGGMPVAFPRFGGEGTVTLASPAAEQDNTNNSNNISNHDASNKDNAKTTPRCHTKYALHRI